MNKKIKSTLKIALFFLLALFFVWWFVSKLSKDEVNDMFNSFKYANYFWFVLAVVINSFSHYIRALRWRLLIKPLGYETGKGYTFLAVMSCYLTNLAVPRLGEIVRSTMITSRYKVSFDKTLGTVITERAVDTLLFVLIFFVAFLFEYNLFKDYIIDNLNIDLNKYTFLFVIGIIGVLFAIILLFIFRKKLSNNKIYNKIKGFFSGIWQGMKTVLKLEKPYLFIAYSLFIWFLWIFGTWILFKAMTETFSLGMKQAMVVTVLGSIGTMITPGGIGIYPTIFAKVLEVYSIKRAVGYALGWLCWLVSQIGPVLIGPIGFIIFAKGNKNKNVKDNVTGD
ncbi:MAG: flippase-like domain-containing protein [Bacteroidales bacterium]|nr:flippase-like domain-containing protein [Bacteroidales bacterium]